MEIIYGVRTRGAIFECVLLLFGFWLIALPLIMIRGVKLANDYSDTKIISVFISVVYLLLLFSEFVSDHPNPAFVVIIVIPPLIGMFIIAAYRAAQKPYRREVDKFVELLNTQKTFTWKELNERFPKTLALQMLKPNIPTCILKDLQRNYLIDYMDDGQAVSITFIAPTLKKGVIDLAWVCTSCGAKNDVLDGRVLTQCEYCGTDKKG